MVKQVAIWAVLLFLYPIQGGKSQQSGQEFRPLKDLQRISIVVESLGTRGRSLGLSISQLESKVLVGLKRNIPRLTISKDAPSYIYVNVNSISDTTAGGRYLGFSIYVDVQLYRPVAILSNDFQTSIGVITVASVWNDGRLMGGPKRQAAEAVNRALDRVLTTFAADYYRQNP